ncbi:sulfatase-like hydrolase/transferase [Akkermansiaceae bacterium]|nr:sulfatase-like hydrolase/transferase [Akkermansiaceae bacterium]
MNPRSLIAAAILSGQALPAADRPNIVLIMADDMGYENLSCHGSKLNGTPHLDRLAAGGMRFDNAHSQPLCTPSRVQIMTGIDNNRNYVRFGLLDPEATTFANILRDSGYETCIAGKWQLEGGYDAPRKFGFDRYCLWQLNRRPSRYPNPGFEIDGKQVDFRNGEFGPDIVTDYICDFIEAKKDSGKPFLVYYPMMLPHYPFVPTPDSPDWDPDMWKDERDEPGGYHDQKHWKGFVSYTDKMVGKLVAKLDEAGIRENTLVVFTADNGTLPTIRQEFNGRVVRGAKGSTIDDGTHVPFIASWPGTIKPGQVAKDLVSFTDVLPTLCEAASAPIPEKPGIDGSSILPLLKGEAYNPRPDMYCWYERSGARNKASQHMRTDRYKLYQSGKFYDTFADPLEESDLTSADLPENLKPIHAELKAALDRRAKETERFDTIQKARQNRLQAPGKKRK